MVVTKTKAPGAPSNEPLVRAFEEIRPGKVRVLERGPDAPRELAPYGPLVYVGDDPFTLDERGWPLANAGCLFLPDLSGQFLPELTNPVFVTARVNHGEGFIAMADAIQRVRGRKLSPDEEYKLVTEFYSPARIIGQHQPDFLVRQENVPDGAHLAELGESFARHYLGIPPMRARIDVQDNFTRNALIKSGRRYVMEPLHLTSREEAEFLARNQGTTEHGVHFYYAPTGERYLTVDQLRAVVEDYNIAAASAQTEEAETKARELLAGRLGDISRLAKTDNEYKKLVLKQNVKELYFFEVDARKFNVGDVDRMLERVRSGVQEKELESELHSFLERYVAATPPDYHHCNPAENQLFRRQMIRALRQLPEEIPYEIRAEWIHPESDVGGRILPALREHYGDHPINLGILLHTASKRAIAGERLTGIAEVWENPGTPRLIHVRDSYFNPEECRRNFRRMPDGSILGRDRIDSPEILGSWTQDGRPLDAEESRTINEEYLRFRADRIAAHRLFFRHLGDEDVAMPSERLGDTPLWVRVFDPELIALDKRPARDHGNVEETKAIQASFGRLLAVNVTAAASTLVGTGDELYAPANPAVVRQTDATNCYILERLMRRTTDDPSMYVMAAIYEAETELISDVMRVSGIRLEGVRKSLLDGFVESQRRIEEAVPALIDDAQRMLFDAPRGEVAGARFNMPKKMLLAVARFIDPARPDAPALFDRLVNMRYADGTQVLKTSNPEDERIRRALDSARGGALYAKPLEIAEAISTQTDSLTEVGRRVIAREEDTENKTELIDELTVALSTDCTRVHAAVATLEGDREFPRLPYGEKISRLRMLKLRQAINTSSTRSILEVEDYARECALGIVKPVDGRQLFTRMLPQQFPGLYFTEEDSRFFYDTAIDRERYQEYRRLGYC